MLSVKDLDITDNPVSYDEESHITYKDEPVHGRKQSWKEVLILAYSSLGAIYGDIGTSPLYVLGSVKYPNDTPTKNDIYGSISLIFWLFIILVLAKYTLIVLTFGPNEGEGGQVAIYAKIARCLKIGPKGVTIPGSPEKSDLELLIRTETTSSFMSNRTGNQSWKKHPAVLNFVSIFTMCGCFLGCSLVFSDGLLTPTTSVLSAIAGIQVAKPDFDNVLAVSEVVIIVLFLIQQFGSHKISHAFAPIILVWLIGLVVCGIINITKHPAIFKALSPYYAISLLKDVGIDCLGGAMLAITGTEAMFADLGHFGKLPTQIGITFVFVCLIITYLGQGAYLVVHPEGLANVFYLSIPGGINSGFYWVMFVLATLATVIASQALILGVFSILAQLINLDCFPKLKVKHVSADYVGKVYVPAANFLLLIGVCATTAGFKNSNNVTAAYGLGISLDFVVTSLLMVLCMAYVYEFPWYVMVLFCAIFVPLEMCLVIANIKKVPHGAWFPLMMCGIFFLVLVFWRYCRDKAVGEQLAGRVRLTDLFPDLKTRPIAKVVKLGTATDDDDGIALDDNANTETLPLVTNAYKKVSSRFGAVDIKTHPGVAIIYSDTPQQDVASPNTVPGVYGRILREFASIPSIVIFCTVRVLSLPMIDESERILVSSTKIPGHFKCVLRFGFMEEVVIDDKLGQLILNQFLEVEHLKRSSGEVPILHVFENNKIKAREFADEEHSTKNPFVYLGRCVRLFLINQVFSPINAIFQYNDLYVLVPSEELEKTEKIFIGGVMRI